MSESPRLSSGLALASAVTGVLGLTDLAALVFGFSVRLLGLPGLAFLVVAVVTGGLALWQWPAPGGRWLAWTGVALGVLGLATLAAGVVLLGGMSAHH